jgi:pimeloyl-ACP methyl ester carboxylesterase
MVLLHGFCPGSPPWPTSSRVWLGLALALRGRALSVVALCPAAGWSGEGLLPDADWIELEGAGHIPMSDDPAQVSEAILDFTASI